MEKDFNDFMAEVNSKDWTKIAEDAAKESNGDVIADIIHASIKVNTTILREYHNWLQRED